MKDNARGRRSEFGSFIVDARGTILGFDEGMEQLTGWPAVEVVGRSKDLGLVAGTAGREGSRSIRTMPLYEGRIPTDSGTRNRDILLNAQDGSRLEVEARVRRLDGVGERMLVTVLRVLSRAIGAASRAATPRRDVLTGLADGELFADRLSSDFASAATTARPLALILLDVDHLREINDQRGRIAGDEVLRKLGAILRVAVENDGRVARLGDDDFAILLRDAGRGEARQVAAGLRSTVERYRFFPAEPGSSLPQLTITLGAASFPADADNEHELVERAKEALDEARAMGRNRVWCYLRRPRVPLQVPVFFDGADPLIVGYTRDLSPSGVFVQTSAAIDVGMRCALAFSLPGQEGKVHVVGRVVRTVPAPVVAASPEARVPGLGVEFERFGGDSDRRAIERFLHQHESLSRRPETGRLSVPQLG